MMIEKESKMRNQAIGLVKYTGMILGAFMAIVVIFSLIPLPDEGDLSSESVTETISNALPTEINILTVVGNNIRVVVFTAMLHPLGVMVALMTAVVLGVGVSAFAAEQSVSPMLKLLDVMDKPFFWLEITAYCLTAAQSIYMGRVLRPKGMVHVIKSNILQIVSLFRPSTWRNIKMRDKTVSWKVYLLMAAFHIDPREVNRKELKKQVIITLVIIGIATGLLTVGAMEEIYELQLR